MFCPNCGNQVPDGQLFCSACGTDMSASAPSAGTPVVPRYSNPGANKSGYATPGYSAPSYSAPSYPTPSHPTSGYSTPSHYAPAPTLVDSAGSGDWSSRFIQAWKTFVTSPACLILLIGVTLIQVLTVINITTTSPLDSVYSMFNELGISTSQIRSMMSDLEEAIDSASLASMVPSVLMIVGMWLLYVDARNPGSYLKTTGLTIIKVLQVISLVGVCIAFGFALILLLSAMGEASRYGSYGEAINEALSVVTWVLIIVGGLVIGYYAMVLKVINATKRAMETFVPEAGPAAALGVLNFIFGAISLMSALANNLDFITLLSSASPILYGVVLISLKNTMENLSRERAGSHGGLRYR